jgi:pimeloyl-ACP methyl ester carboxylesterase
MKALHALALCAALVAPVLASETWAAAPPSATPAAMQQMALPSHGSTLLGVFYLAAGAGPHPTAIIFHGFPGYEQNLDIAQTLRAHGWNVLAMHYRGSWGVKGNFSFEHAVEDADTEVQFLLDPANTQKYRIDPHRIIVIGHSLGGYMAASAIAHNPQVAAAVLISAWNIGADYETHHHLGAAPPTVANEAKALAENNNLAPLAGTSGLLLAREIRDHEQGLNFLNLASSIAPRPVFVTTASEGLAPTDHALAEAITKAGDTHVTERHWDTDHNYSGQRAELANAILQWTANLPH